MSQGNPSDKPQGTCYVVMGLGKKTDFETGRTLDLDKTYKNIIKPAAAAAGLTCTRVDEIPHAGFIDLPMYEQLLTADVVVVDLSASHKAAFYELGVRHALRPHTTVVICEDGVKGFPFDLNHILVRQYHHMGEAIDFDEVERFRGLLTQVLKDILGREPRPKDSPVYTFLRNLNPPALAEAMKGVAGEVAKATPVGEAAGHPGDVVYSELMAQVDEAQRNGDFLTAKELLRGLRKMARDAAAERPEDPGLIQRLAFVTYKSKHPGPGEALIEARDLLLELNPATTNDTETLGMWGAVHKRLWDLTGERSHLEEAVSGYERGFYLRNDYYNGINYAYLLNVRAAHAASRAEAVADFVQAARARREVLDICDEMLGVENLSDDDKYWVLATKAEAFVGVGDEAAAEQALREASASAGAAWMNDSTAEQLSKLRELLADSPLRYVRPRFAES